MKQISDLVLQSIGKADGLVEYRDVEPATTLEKKVDISRAAHDLKHQSIANLRQGVAKTIGWQKEVYGCD